MRPSITFILVALLLSCNKPNIKPSDGSPSSSDSNTSDQKFATSELSNAIKMTKFLVSRENTLLRDAPSLQSNKLQLMNKGDKLKLHRITPVSELTIGGKQVTAPWIEVTHKKTNLKGWVFGELITPYYDFDNKQLYFDSGDIVIIQESKSETKITLPSSSDDLDPCANSVKHLAPIVEKGNLLFFVLNTHSQLFGLMQEEGCSNIYAYNKTINQILRGPIGNKYLTSSDIFHLFSFEYIGGGPEYYSIFNEQNNMFNKYECYRTSDSGFIIDDFKSNMKFSCYILTDSSKKLTYDNSINDNCDHEKMGWSYVQELVWNSGKIELKDNFKLECLGGDCVADCSNYPMK